MELELDQDGKIGIIITSLTCRDINSGSIPSAGV